MAEGILIALGLALTIYRAIRAPSREDELADALQCWEISLEATAPTGETE